MWFPLTSHIRREISNSSRVDIFGLKVEGSVPVLWVSDSDDIRLFGMGGGADAFPDTSYYPADMRPYAPSMLRIERTTNFKLINLFDGGPYSCNHNHRNYCDDVDATALRICWRMLVGCLRDSESSTPTCMLPAKVLAGLFFFQIMLTCTSM